jgi:ElaA protein
MNGVKRSRRNSFKNYNFGKKNASTHSHIIIKNSTFTFSHIHNSLFTTLPMIWTLKPFNELTAKELYNILQLRNEVFIVEQNCPYQDLDNKDLRAWHLMGMQDGNLLAYSRLLAPGISYSESSIGRIVSSPSARKKGIGKKLMLESIDQIRNLFQTDTIRIGAQLYLQKFYESFGFNTDSDIYLEDDIPHIQMLRKPK